MDEFIANEVLCRYERLERSVLEFGERVPLTVENESQKAPILASALIDASSLLDSIFRDMTRDPMSVNGKTKTKNDCNIVDFAWLHSQSLDLPNTQSVMLVSPSRYRVSFEKWKASLHRFETRLSEQSRQGDRWFHARCAVRFESDHSAASRYDPYDDAAWLVSFRKVRHQFRSR